ncbi:proteinral negative regulator of transcription subunit 5 [Purpureocillium takamizusanense]|uniref:General negative regulator of transcription subunit n=1 Tax=Purpureocillium takamizusanense TaxID=2060973 RepID=A0A9Q8QJV6_9HYPO|nr:general negative regulator of transcription subunit 5 [Purpureocillium takamizusanense]UNI21193.1 proteinral negative regulator of transcription subunit 5 [Purpureocillium takamizusanense]
MAARKLQQEVDKCFKKVAEGVAEFEAIYEKIEQSNNPAQKEKLEDNLKREIKKLQRLRDQIKTWAASNDIKDKAPLLEHRKLIETQMEKFKAVEKAMKTKAYSKEGLSAAAKLDPKEQAKVEAGEFLSNMVDELEQQIESLEAESETIQATMKKGKNQGAKADRMAEIDRIIEQHKWHQGKLELIRRSLENGGVETDQVNDLEENIRYYVTDGMNEEYMEDEAMYDDLNLDEDEGTFGMTQDNEKSSSQDTQSVQDEPPAPEPEQPPAAAAGAAAATTAAAPKPISRKAQKDPEMAGGRKASVQSKSPLPALATLHTPLLSTMSNGSTSGPAMKPASLPTRPAGEGLKYASAAAAAAASDKNVGIAPLPPPPGSAPVSISPLPSQAKTSATSSPASTSVQPVPPQQPEPKQAPMAGPPPAEAEPTSSRASRKAKAAGKQPAGAERSGTPSTSQTNGATNGVKRTAETADEECIYHLPAALQDLVDTYDASRKRPVVSSSPATVRLMSASQMTSPDSIDAEVPRTYRPDVPVPPTGSGFPREPLPIFDDPRLYSRIDPDTLFYVFYYKQGTAQQYLAAKALKDQSWRFHKQYQTWFQRHEEPKNITEEFEQGTYRFFDYESTWMNRRKADFKFAYKFLEDDI